MATEIETVSQVKTMPAKVEQPIVVAAVYKFARLDDYESLREPLLQKMRDHDVHGSLLLAAEGINGTISATRENMDTILAYLRKDDRLKELVAKESMHKEHPFLRTKVKLKNEIVTMGVPGIDPTKSAGTYVEPKDWNALISDPNTILIDTRNDYEYDIGTFENAVNPNTKKFTEFPEYVDKTVVKNLDEFKAKGKKVAMFCTGGIRCEKSTSYLVEKGLDKNQVFHLKGGILKYLEEIDPKETMWKGECFVFDERVSVDHDLKRGSYESCHGCRRPISAEDKKSELYVEGVKCSRCANEVTEKHLQRVQERAKQIELAKQRGVEHIHDVDTKAERKAKKAKKSTKAEQQE